MKTATPGPQRAHRSGPAILSDQQDPVSAVSSTSSSTDIPSSNPTPYHTLNPRRGRKKQERRQTPGHPAHQSPQPRPSSQQPNTATPDWQHEAYRRPTEPAATTKRPRRPNPRPRKSLNTLHPPGAGLAPAAASSCCSHRAHYFTAQVAYPGCGTPG